MPQGAKYYVYSAAVLEVIRKIYIKLHITITEKEELSPSMENHCYKFTQYLMPDARMTQELFFYIQLKNFYKHITNYNNYKLRYNTTKRMPQGAKYYVYSAAVLEVIRKIYIKLHITITEKEELSPSMENHCYKFTQYLMPDARMTQELFFIFN